ncbi:MAG: hypothetical protein BMS9Abin22_216 [Gammaproteobacteria bacterium]|nr:MAG: hypothetical protein BMS9Abin22_216 [Gammaproteobacteria bacterium]
MYCEQYVRIHEQDRDWYECFTPTTGDATELKIYTSEKLNERYYGDLQGINKDEARRQFGAGQVHQWRRSYDVPPPNGESLKMTAERALPYYKEHIALHLQQDKTVLVSAHGNSLRALVMVIEDMTPEEIINYEFPTGTPHVYEIDRGFKLTNKHIVESSM